MKRPITVVLLAATLAIVACYRSPKFTSLPVERYTTESASGYKWEMGQLTAAGFTPSLVLHKAYRKSGPSVAELSRVSGRTVIQLNAWNQLGQYVRFKRSPESVTLQEVPYVFVDP